MRILTDPRGTQVSFLAPAQQARPCAGLLNLNRSWILTDPGAWTSNLSLLIQ